jgi:hypothetical protein
LTVPALEQDIIRCLIRTPLLTAQQIAGRLRQPLTEIENTLRSMEGNERLTRSESSGETQFQVPLKNDRSRRSTNLLDSLFG